MTRIAPLLLAAALAVPSAAGAHIVFAEPQAAAGSYYAGFLRVGHGCGAAPTVSIRVEIPPEVAIARPQPKPGWTVAVERTPLAEPMRSEGGALVRERVSAITWTGALPADQFDQFGIMMKLPGRAGPLYFPTRQSCAEGRNDWVAIPAAPEAWHETQMPAPMLVLHGGHGEHPAK